MPHPVRDEDSKNSQVLAECLVIKQMNVNIIPCVGAVKMSSKLLHASKY
jgi:hypothetical protein